MRKWRVSTNKKKTLKPIAFVLSHRSSLCLNLIYSILLPLAVLLATEWIARGGFGPNKTGTGFFQSLYWHFPSFFIAFLLLVSLYVFVSQITGCHPAATAVVGLAGILPAVVTYFKLTMRGEPFLPWDIFQISDLMAVKSNVRLVVPANVWVTLAILAVLAVLSAAIKVPCGSNGKKDWVSRLILSAAAAVCGVGLIAGIFLSPTGSAAVGIREDMWMQDRYTRTHGVITAFLTNLQMLKIAEPENYSADAVIAVADEVAKNAAGTDALYPNSYAAKGKTAETPNIIYLMAESFWDVTALPGISYDREIMPNFNALRKEGAYGVAYTPSFGGGTCDVEFEALTGFSMENLPAGSKPFQQYVTDDTFALPWVLKERGYQTLAIHGYGREFWSRDVAYPHLGIDNFYGSEAFVNPDMRRGFISDNAMVDRIIEEYEERRTASPVFIHAVTMQNHTTYARNRYPAQDLVRVTGAPSSIPDSTIGQLEDCATGIYEMDAALGKLTAYLRGVEEPVILVFWGDHMNPMSDGYSLFETTGFIENGDTSSPRLRGTPLLIWSNFDDGSVQLGTLSTYNLTPVMMELYGMPKPVLYEFLVQQFPILHGRTRGVTINGDSSAVNTVTDAQRRSLDKHALLEYDYLFGDRALEELPGG